MSLSTATTEPSGPKHPARGRSQRADRFRLVARGLGQLLITCGVVILLFVVYEVWVTNLFAATKQNEVKTALQHEWATGQDPQGESAASTRVGLPGTAQSTIPAGTGIANLYIPRFGKDFVFAIVQGTSDADLEKGPGHYENSALPGQAGNFAVAGHRVGKGEPFLNLDQLMPGDPVVVQTKDTWFVYQVLGQGTDLGAKDANGVPGREIVDPSDIDVIAPTPDGGQTPAGSYLTLTTCHPKYSASQRMVLHAKLIASKPTSGAALPTELGGTL